MNEQAITRVGLSLFVILFGSFMAPLMLHSSTLAIPAIASELRLDAEDLSFFTLLNLLGAVCMVLPAGKLADIYGRKRIFCIGLVLIGVACLLGGFAQNAGMLLSGRFMQGVGGAFIFGSAIALVSTIPPEDKKQQVMGLYIAVAYMGIVVGPLFGGLMIDHFHWRWVFHVPAISFLSTAVIGFGLLRWERYGDRNSRLRLLDTCLYIISLVMIALAVFRTHELTGQLIMLAGLLSFAGFCWFQTKRRDPLLQVTLFRDNSIYATLGLTHFLSYSGILSLPFIATLYLQYIKAIDAQTTGYVLLVQALFTAMTSPAGGWLANRFRVRYILYAGMAVMVFGMVLLANLHSESSVWVLVLALASIGFSVGLVDTQLLSICMNSVEDRLLGSASATLNGLRAMGGFVGMGVISYLMGSTIGKQEITPQIYPQVMTTIHNFFMVAAVLAGLSFLLLYVGLQLRDRARRNNATN